MEVFSLFWTFIFFRLVRSLWISFVFDYWSIYYLDLSGHSGLWLFHRNRSIYSLFQFAWQEIESLGAGVFVLLDKMVPNMVHPSIFVTNINLANLSICLILINTKQIGCVVSFTKSSKVYWSCLSSMFSKKSWVMSRQYAFTDSFLWNRVFSRYKLVIRNQASSSFSHEKIICLELILVQWYHWIIAICINNASSHNLFLELAPTEKFYLPW